MSYELDYLETLPALFADAVERHRDLNAYARRENDSFIYVSYTDVRDQVEIIAMGIRSMGYDMGERVAILSENRPEWIMTDYACAHFGLISVPVYPTLLSDQVSYILNDSGAALIFVSNEIQAKKIISIKEKLPNLRQMIIYKGGEEFTEDWIFTFDTFLKSGEDFKAEVDYSLEDEGNKVKPEDLWTIIYTSGTTGTPKGVMLTQYNVATNAQASQGAVQFNSARRWISFLPYSHSLERIAAHFSFWIGSTVYVIESIEKVLDALQKFKPHYFVSVPRLYEKVYNSVLERIYSGSFVKRGIFNWATKVGTEVSINYLQKNRVPEGWLAWKYNLAQNLVFSKITDLFGGEAKQTISGGAPLSKEIGQFFASAGLIITEGFGLTEMSPVTNANRQDNIKFGSVGPTIPDVKMKIADDGEILFKGPNKMKGYYNDPESTAEVIDDDGWLHSGDIGEIDEDGHLVITDRKKNLIVTSGGKNIAPAPLEQQLTGSRYIDQVMVIGDKRKYVSALIVPNQESIEYWAKSNGIDYENFEELVKSEPVNDLIHKEISNIQQDFASFEQIKRFALLEKPFTVEDGELTPTLKVKRRVVEDKYKDVIESLYPGS